jgi:hypothetical protein
MSKERAVNFPSGVPYGTTHFEHGRTFEYVEPGMWKSIGGSGGGGGGGGIDDAPQDGLIYARQDGQWVQITSGGGGSGPGGPVEWADVLNKPQPIKNLAGENTSKVSMVSGGTY